MFPPMCPSPTNPSTATTSYLPSNHTQQGEAARMTKLCIVRCSHGERGTSDNRDRLAVTLAVQPTVDEYIRRYSERDVEGVTDLCLWPFLAVRKGEAIHLPDRAAVRDHFAGTIVAYRVMGVVAWKQVEIDARRLGEHSFFATVHWNAVADDGEVLRDTWTSYQLLDTSDGWRFLSYTNHF
jgi:hypothetical protein